MPGAISAIAAILRQAPVLLAAADALVARTRKPPVTAADLDGLRQRLADLEQHQQANAALAKDLADHSGAMATAVQAAAARARQAFLLGIVAVALGASALLIALLR
jgi:phage/plasmid primase-like uncharacterized protein